MKKALLYIVVMALLSFGSAFALPNLQLFVDGGTYDAESESWVTTSGTFDIYVIGANEALSDVHVSMALGFAEDYDPNGEVSVDVNGTTYDAWTYGHAPLETAPGFDPGDDLAAHGVFPAWFTEFNAGDFDLVGGVGDVQPQPDYWDPSTEGYIANSRKLGEYKVFSVAVTGTSFIHFDAFTLNPDGSIQNFAPFSHDASMVPEPGTLVLLALGGIGLGIYRRYRI